MEKKDVAVKNRIALRKKLKKEAAASLGIPENTLGWYDGKLVFLVDNRRVNGVPIMPKPTKPAEETTSTRSYQPPAHVPRKSRADSWNWLEN